MGLVCMNLSTRQCRDKKSQRREGCARSFPATEIKMFQGPELSRLISLHQTVGDLSKTCPKSRCFGGMIIHQPKTFEQFYLLEASLSKVYRPFLFSLQRHFERHRRQLRGCILLTQDDEGVSRF